MRASLAELNQQKAELEEAQGIKISSDRYSDLLEIEPAALDNRVFPDGSLARSTRRRLSQASRSTLPHRA